MENKSVSLVKHITVGGNYFGVDIQIQNCKTNKWVEDIHVNITKFNDEKLSYLYTTSKPYGNNRGYIESIQEALDKFLADEKIQDLIKWEGNTKN